MTKKPSDQKYLAVRNYIIGAIHGGRLRPGDRIPSEYGLARRFGVNKTTCNKAVATLVSEGYLRRKPGAGTFVLNEFSSTAPLIGVLMSIGSGMFFSQLLIGIQEEAASRGYGLLFFQLPGRDTNMDRFWKFLLSTGLKGLIVNRPFVRVPSGIHSVYLDTAPPEGEKPSYISTDDFSGGRLLANHFIENGHKHIAFISQDVSRQDLLARLRGFDSALKKAKLQVSSRRLHSFSRSEQNLYATLRSLLRSDHRITAIGFDSVHVASEALEMLSKLRKRVPEDISIGGFGTVSYADKHPRITTVEQHPLSMGHAAAELLVKSIEGRTSRQIQQCIPVDLVPGDTVRKI